MKSILQLTLALLLAGCIAQPEVISNNQYSHKSASNKSETRPLDDQWQTYDHDWFIIQVPQNSKIIGSSDYVLVAPSVKDPSVVDPPWNNIIYDRTKFPSWKTLELVSENGTQFTDRQELIENISINGRPALLQTVSTQEHANWISRTIIIELPRSIITINNGANYRVDQQFNFEKFYQSIHLKD